MASPAPTRFINGVPIQEFPAGLSSKALQKRDKFRPNYEQHGSDPRYVSGYFIAIPKDERYEYLRKKAKDSPTDYSIKLHLVRFNTGCYSCYEKATVLHHVVPLSAGGQARKRNVVPVCDACHYKVHASHLTFALPVVRSAKSKKFKASKKLNGKLPDIGAINRKTLKKLDKNERLPYLLKAAYIPEKEWRSDKERNALRAEYEATRNLLCPIKHLQQCMCCVELATIRHHIVPLSSVNGTNTAKNLVALCAGCHAKIHPWLAVSETPKGLIDLKVVVPTMQPIVPAINNGPERGLRGTVA